MKKISKKVAAVAKKFADEVYPAYIAMGWKWATGEITPEAIEGLINRHASKVDEEGLIGISSGGITVSAREDGEESPYIEFSYRRYLP